MNGKIILIIATIILIISSYGLFVKTNTKHEQKQQEQKIKIELITATKEISKGANITPDDIKIEQKEVNTEYLKDSFIVNKPLSFLIGSSTNKIITAGNPIRFEDVVFSNNDTSDDSLNVNNEGELPFSFELMQREFNTIKHVKKGEFVDVYFKYETKTKNKDDGIVSKGLENANTQSKENANLSKLILLLKNKRVLNLKIDKNKTMMILLQLKPDEIKSIYAIEHLGKFYFFPAQDNAKNSVSTKKILSQDFIKELRGGENK